MTPALNQVTREVAVLAREEPLDSTQTILQLNPNPPAPNFEDLKWGQRFTPHMLCVPWKQGSGWGAPVIQPFGPLSISPAAPVLQYASSCFEGMKAYRCSDGHVRLFRPDMNMARMNRSAARASLPTFDGIEMVKLIKKLIQVDLEHIPHLMGESLYLRPTLIGTPDSLGMGRPSEALLYCICNPVGSYFGVGAGIQPISLLAISKEVRAWPGGLGSYKLAANYVGATLLASQALGKGHQQVLWLFGEDPELTEVGAMNLFVVMKSGDKVLVCTPSLLDGTILPGVTRDSVVTLLREYAAGTVALEGLPEHTHVEVQERRILMREVAEAASRGDLLEVFGSGTAACICPVRSITLDDEKIVLPRDENGAFAREMYRQITSRQWGIIPDNKWTVTCA
ncbi:hypothetical protein CBS101457_002905 [Exobasidium rhododendri]|nr:hypothetical protein CBS101457_002905 [Exobasidium rhododendri]